MAIDSGTQRETTNLRYGIGVLFFVVSLFQVVALGVHSGWAQGSVSTRSAYHTQYAPAACPDDLLDADLQAACVASQTIQGMSQTTLAFGLFRALSYAMSNSTETTTNLYQQVNATTTRLLSSHVDYASDEWGIVQNGYRSWAQGNPAAMSNVTGAQVGLVLSFWLCTVSWIVLVVALHYTPSKRRSEARIKMSQYLLLAASGCLFLCFSMWAAIPVRAFTKMCVQEEEQGGAVTCTQLLSAPCESLLAEDPLALCSSSGNVNKRAGVWGLILLCWTVGLFIVLFIGQLHEAVVSSEGTTPREPLLGDVEEARGTRAQRMPTAIVS